MKNSKYSIWFGLKRFFAAFIDVCLTLILTLFVYFIVVEPIFERTTEINQYREQYNEKYEEYGVMIWSEEWQSYVNNPDATEEQKEAFNNDPIVKELYEKINSIVYREFTVSCTISTALIFILVPMISKKGTTVGKKALGLIVVSTKKEELKKTQVLVREISFILIELVGGLITYGIIPLVSLILIIINKKSLHDYLSKTNVKRILNSTSDIVSEEDDEYYKMIAKEQARDLRVGGKKND